MKFRFLSSSFRAIPFLAWTALLIVLAPASISAQPTVSNVEARQLPGSKLVEVTYDLAVEGGGAVAVSLDASRDGGANFDSVPEHLVSGAVGEGQEEGVGKTIVWNAGAMGWEADYFTQVQVEVTAVRIPFVEIDLEENTIGPALQSYSINVTSNTTWVVEEVPGWITVSPASGSGNETLTVTVEENIGALSRNAVILIGGLPHELTQEGETDFIRFKPEVVELDGSGQSFVLNINTDSQFHIGIGTGDGGPDWISLSSGTATMGSAITVTVDANDTGAPRNGSLTFLNQAGGVNGTFSFLQNAEISTTIDPVMKPGSSSAMVYSIAVSSVGEWAIDNRHDWIHITEEEGSGDSVVVVNVDENLSGNIRTGSFIVGGKAHTVRQMSEAPEVTVDPPYMHIDHRAQEFEIEYTGIGVMLGIGADNMDWSSVTALPGGRARIEVDENPLPRERYGFVALRVSGGPTEHFYFYQGAKPPGSIHPVSQNVTAVAQTYTITVTSTASWSVQEFPDWVTVDPSSGAGDAEITVTVEENTDVAERSGTIVIDGQTHTVTQEGALRIIALSGDLVFGEVTVGQTATRTLMIENTGNSPLEVTGIDFPDGFNGDWSGGVIAAGGSQEITVTFSPAAEQSYGVTLTVNSNATSGTNTRSVSGTGVAAVGTPTGAEMEEVQGGTLAMSMGTVAVDTFWIGKHEVTWGFWKEVRDWAAANGYDIGDAGAGCADDHPVHSVNWFDVVKWSNAFTEYSNAVNGTDLTPVYTVSGAVYSTGEPSHTSISQDLSANGYRLPLEVEWEFAARGGNQTDGYTYAGSNDLNAVGWYRDNSDGSACNLWEGRGTWPVGQKAANELGLYDMSGNVWEWCWDGVDSNNRRFLGGGWASTEEQSSVSHRSVYLPAHPAIRWDATGFRLARGAVDTATLTRIIELTGNLDFGEVEVGQSATRTFVIGNTGNSPLEVTGIDYPTGFSGDWSGVIAGGESQEITVTFSPGAEESYGGTVTVHSDATEGVNILTVSGTGSISSDPSPFPGNFVLIPEGWFQMGNVIGDLDSWSVDRAPVVNVFVSDYYIAKHPVTIAEWDEVRTWGVSNGFQELSNRSEFLLGLGKDPNHPVSNVNWFQAVAWCNARTEWENATRGLNLTPVYRNSDGGVFKGGTTEPTVDWSADGYRLPTEAEWEKAARGGLSGRRFPWGDIISHNEANFRNDGGETIAMGTTGYHPDFSVGNLPYTSPVGSFSKNGYGLYDMAGNVWEWCWDWFDENAYMEGAIDPLGPVSGATRVCRGGSFGSHAFFSRLSVRNSNAGSGVADFGFRLVRGSGNLSSEYENIKLSGDLSFGSVIVGRSAEQKLIIANRGKGPVKVTGLTFPSGFSGNWSGGTIAEKSSTTVIVTFTPSAEQSYGGIITVQSDSADAHPTSVTGTGVAGIAAPPGFSLIPEGWFQMGDALDGDPFNNAPVVDVHVKDFYLAKHQLTKAEWDAVRSWAVSHGYVSLPVGYGKGVNHPVVEVSWWDSVAWCNARTEWENATKGANLSPVYRNTDGSVYKGGTIEPAVDWTADGYRLPTEAEWEKAARGGKIGRRFPWGNIISHSEANFRNDGGETFAMGTTGLHPDYAGPHVGPPPYTSPVGSFPANEYGLYDMAGNVLEWCWNRYGVTYGTIDPPGPAFWWPSLGTNRVIRGGVWNLEAARCKISTRFFADPDTRYDALGFRIARSSGQ